MQAKPRLTVAQLAGMIDHTFLKPFGPPVDIEKLCDEARQCCFAVTMVSPAEIEHCVRLLAGSDRRIGTTIGFPLGQSTSKVKDFETRDAIARGAREIDMVINLRALQGGDEDLVRSEIADLVQACRPAGVVCKVILETCYLTDEQKRRACEIAGDEGVDFVKTSTGFGSGGATVEDVALMRRTVAPQVGVKASGGIRDLTAALAMISAGATRIGTSSGMAILREYAKALRLGPY